nr:hypothetical protein [Ruegeria arenilitoris]
MNARPGVRGFTIEKVNKAIAELGYIRGTPRKTRLACTRTAAATQ